MSSNPYQITQKVSFTKQLIISSILSRRNYSPICFWYCKLFSAQPTTPTFIYSDIDGIFCFVYDKSNNAFHFILLDINSYELALSIEWAPDVTDVYTRISSRFHCIEISNGFLGFYFYDIESAETLYTHINKMHFPNVVDLFASHAADDSFLKIDVIAAWHSKFRGDYLVTDKNLVSNKQEIHLSWDEIEKVLNSFSFDEVGKYFDFYGSRQNAQRWFEEIGADEKAIKINDSDYLIIGNKEHYVNILVNHMIVDLPNRYVTAENKKKAIWAWKQKQEKVINVIQEKTKNGSVKKKNTLSHSKTLLGVCKTWTMSDEIKEENEDEEDARGDEGEYQRSVNKLSCNKREGDLGRKSFERENNKIEDKNEVKDTKINSEINEIVDKLTMFGIAKKEEVKEINVKIKEEEEVTNKVVDNIDIDQIGDALDVEVEDRNSDMNEDILPGDQIEVKNNCNELFEKGIDDTIVNIGDNPGDKAVEKEVFPKDEHNTNAEKKSIDKQETINSFEKEIDNNNNTNIENTVDSKPQSHETWDWNKQNNNQEDKQEEHQHVEKPGEKAQEEMIIKEANINPHCLVTKEDDKNNQNKSMKSKPESKNVRDEVKEKLEKRKKFNFEDLEKKQDKHVETFDFRKWLKKVGDSKNEVVKIDINKINQKKKKWG